MTILDRQNLLDIAIQLYGDASVAFELARLNNISVTDNLVAGQELQLLPVSSNLSGNKNIAQYYANGRLKPATGIAIEDEITSGGIEFMGIEIDFVVS
jgi:hypothetical protein